MKFRSHSLFIILSSGILTTFAAQSDSNSPSLHTIGSRQVLINTSELQADGTFTKVIAVKRVLPSEDFIRRKVVLGNAELNYEAGIVPFNKSAGAVDLGMNNVPVLDQGQYGTCVTFASTAAVDALLGKGDFVSQQCSLELNLGLGNNYWDGADYASEIIDPLKQYGIVQQGHCDFSYPTPDVPMLSSVYEFYANKTVTAKAVDYTFKNAMSLADLRTALNKGHRVTIGFGLLVTSDPISTQGFDITVNGKKSTGGLWACQQPSSKTNYCGTPTDGHDVIVIGYDDKQQLLKIRNSWNTSVGDQGDFYMTYTFFETMNGDGTEIFNAGH